MSPERQTSLREQKSLKELAVEIGQGVVLCSHVVSAGDAPGYKTIESTIDVGETTFDRFFNSQWGYRGAYFRSIEEGLRANQVRFDEIRDKLLAHAIEGANKEDAAWASKIGERSLSADSRRLWLAEATRGIVDCPHCAAGQWGALLAQHCRDSGNLASIQNDKWNAFELERDWTWESGTNAPYLTHIRAFGAFINTEGSVWFNQSKAPRVRAQALHERGWTSRVLT